MAHILVMYTKGRFSSFWGRVLFGHYPPLYHLLTLGSESIESFLFQPVFFFLCYYEFNAHISQVSVSFKSAKFFLHIGRIRKHHRTTVAEEMISKAKSDSTFNKQIKTGKETWIYEFDMKTKRKLSEWCFEDVQKSNVGYFFWFPKRTFLKRLRSAVHRKGLKI